MTEKKSALYEVVNGKAAPPVPENHEGKGPWDWRKVTIGGYEGAGAFGTKDLYPTPGPHLLVGPEGLEGKGIVVHDPDGLEVAPGVLTSKPLSFASYPR